MAAKLHVRTIGLDVSGKKAQIKDDILLFAPPRGFSGESVSGVEGLALRRTRPGFSFPPVLFTKLPADALNAHTYTEDSAIEKSAAR